MAVAAEGVQSMVEDEAVRLVQEILRISGGVPEVSYGELTRDETVQQTFEALLGTLKAARKRGLLTFEGELLLMGQHDNEPIRVLDSALAETSHKADSTVAAASPAPADEPAAGELSAPAGAVQGWDVHGSPEQAFEPASRISPSAAGQLRPEAEEGKDGKSKDGKWAVDMSYIDHRTADPDRLEGRRVSGDTAAVPVLGHGDPGSDVGQPQMTRDKDGKWQPVSTAYINHRTAQVENLEGRRSSIATSGENAMSATSSATVKKEGDGKWKVDTSYINHRTAEVENLEAKQTGSASVDMAHLSSMSATTKKEGDGKWKVDTSYVQHRTAQVENLEGKQGVPTASADSASLPHSATVKKDKDGAWKIDTSYINHRTIDPGRLTKNVEEQEESSYCQPGEKSFAYEELKGVGNRPQEVDPKCKEMYLSPEGFQEVFGMDQDAFLKLPKWKQQNLKKAKDMF